MNPSEHHLSRITTQRAVNRQTATPTPATSALRRIASRAWVALHNAALLLRIAALSYVIWDTERYLREVAEDGLIESLSLSAFRAQLEADRVKRAVLRSRLL